jgi:predicted amidophosphoribosyltransferase
MRCLSCHYDLKNRPENRCPECGREFDPNDPRTFLMTLAPTKRWTRALAIVLTTVVLLLFIAALLKALHNRTF